MSSLETASFCKPLYKRVKLDWKCKNKCHFTVINP